MANNHYKHKDYSNLLKELQKDSKDSTDVESTEMDSTSSSEVKVCSTYEKKVDVSYDLDNLLTSVKNLSDIVSLYDFCEEQVDIEQQITQDLLHAIEFSKSYKQRCKYVTQLHYNRRRRRQYKNTMAVLKPIIDFLQKEENKKAINRLTNILGEARKTKSHIHEKTYSPRILTEIGVISDDAD